MAAFDLSDSDILDALRREISPPGSNFFPDATDDDLTGEMRDAFWMAYLDGFLLLYTESGGLVTQKQPGTPDFSRDLAQLVVFYAGFRILRASLRNSQTSFRATAGPVTYETQSSATVMRDLLAELQQERNILLKRLSDLGVIPTFYMDGVQSRSDAIENGDTFWTAGREYTLINW